MLAFPSSVVVASEHGCETCLIHLFPLVTLSGALVMWQSTSFPSPVIASFSQEKRGNPPHQESLRVCNKVDYHVAFQAPDEVTQS